MKSRTINGGMLTEYSNPDAANFGDNDPETEPTEQIPRETAQETARERGRRTRRSFAAVLVWVVAVFVVTTASPFVLVERNEGRCVAWSERAIEHYRPRAVEVLAEVAETPTYIVGDLPGEMDGLAIWGHTFLEVDAQVETMIHESIHHLQFRSEGVLPYAARYSSDMVHGLYSGCSVHELYLAVRYERQARDVALRFPSSILAVLGERNGSTVEEELWMLQRMGPAQVVEEAQRAAEGAGAAPQNTGQYPGGGGSHDIQDAHRGPPGGRRTGREPAVNQP